METLSEIVVVHLDTHIWSGRKKLRLEDLKQIHSDQIPPDDLASLGSKRICDPVLLAPFERLKKTAERECEAIGIKFLGGWAIPKHQVDFLTRELGRVKTQFDQARIEFLASYGTEINNWIANHPEWGSIIQRAITPKEVVAGKISFDTQMFKVEAVNDSADPDDKSSEGLDTATDGLKGQLLKEITQTAEKAWASSYSGKKSVTRRALRPLVAIQTKLEGLAFIAGWARPVIEQIKDTLHLVPKAGPIEGPILTALDGLLLMLSDKERITTHGQGLTGVVTDKVPEQAQAETKTGVVEHTVIPSMSESESVDGSEPSKDEGPDLPETFTPTPSEKPGASESTWFF